MTPDASLSRETDRIAFGGGNSVSSLVCGILFLRPAIELLSGLPGDPPPVVQAVLGAPLAAANDRRAGGLRASLSVAADGSLVATAFPQQDSAMLHLLSLADGLILREPTPGPRRPVLQSASYVWMGLVCSPGYRPIAAFAPFGPSPASRFGLAQVKHEQTRSGSTPMRNFPDYA